MTQVHYLCLSLAIATLAIAIRQTTTRTERVLVPVFVFVLGTLTVFFWVAHWFTGAGIDESVIFHLKFGIQGAGYGDYRELIFWAVSGLFATFLLALFSALKFHRITKPSGTTSTALFICVLMTSIVLHPGVHGVIISQSGPIRPVVFSEYNDFGDFYRNPSINSAPAKSKNFIVVFLESFERTFFDQSLFPGLVRHLRELENQGVSFTGIDQVPWTGWTVGGLTASLCGLPLFNPSHGNFSMTGLERFLPSATCIGDLLSEENYELTYMSGSSVEFGGTGKLFSSHGFGRVLGKEALTPLLPAAESEGWGLTDDVLLDLAYQEFSEQSLGSKPFGLFLSTIDTHPPVGRVSPGCNRQKYENANNEMLNAIACADEVVGEFVNRIRNSEFADQTVIVLVSDHLSLPNQATHLLEGSSRRNLFLILSPELKAEKIDTHAYPIDIGPTVLSALGYDGELALGRNLLEGESSIADGIPDFQSKMAGWYSSIIQFWGFPNLESEQLLKIDTETRRLQIGPEKFTFPLLMEIDQKGDSIIRFDSTHDGYRLTDYMANMMPRKLFIWVDECASVRPIMSAPNDGYCLVYGRSAGGNISLVHLEDKKVLAASRIRDSIYTTRPPRSSETKRTQATDPNRIIAHAGGSIDGRTYTNSLEALNASYEKGFRKIELDIAQTSDGHFVAAHDWKYWQKQTGFEGDLPPALHEFLAAPIHGKLTPLDMARINHWFENKPEAILVTDKVNSPLEFSERFVDKDRLVMELFTLEAVREGVDAGIRSAMPSEAVIRRIEGNPAETLSKMGVTEVAVSRRLINTNANLLSSFRESGIRTYAYHVNRNKNRNEAHAACYDLDFVYGFYADNYDFGVLPACIDFN